MSIFQSRGPPFVPPPDDVTIPQFILDGIGAHFTRLVRPVECPCFIDEESGRAIYLHELRQRSHQLADVVKGRWDISPGDVVSIYTPNHVDYGVIAWAVQRLGGILATHSPDLTTDELVHQLQISTPVLLIAHPGNLATALRAMQKVRISRERLVILDGHEAPDSRFSSLEDLFASHAMYRPHVEHTFKAGEAKSAIAFLCFSSGTTGKPKAVAVSHYNVICNVVQVATFNRIHEDYAPAEKRRFRVGDIVAGVLPLYHIFGLVINLHLTLYGAMTVVMAKQFNYENLLKSIQRYRITHLNIVPPQAVLFCKHPLTKKYDLSSVRYCVVAGAPMSGELAEQLIQVFPGVQLGQGWGMTETCATGTMFPIEQWVGTPGSCGQLVSGTVAKIVKVDGTLARVEEPGELWIQGPQVVLGYYRNDDATKETFIDGWIRTGDEALFKKNGDMYMTGRIKELIKVKGYQVSPSELEGYLLNHPDVADAAVIGVPDDYAGEVPLAYIVLKPQVAAAVKKDAELAKDKRAKLYKHVSSIASRYKWLDGGVVFIDAVPKSASGKILKRVLIEQSKQLPPRARL
ncbi:phenylacetyl-CoA ligase [Polyporus arcularius HHB13444]|uniref:Phenylacetyl-CoA ligase n=1 Tax=Polyporus arcularius HHB13444 TaxID=1314778 RepID=A0A5C3P9T7_9APHY|nr:phenylacetyl-CoA ligase [Polyporus arcularius HHB13444]